jgi:magnesium-transporting ATPase (P-type)
LLLRALAWQGSLQAGLCFAGFFFLFWTFGYHDLFHLPRTDLLPYAERLSSQDGSVYVMATTIFLAGVVAAQIGNAYACRTERTSVFTIGFFSNRLLLIGIIVELAVVNILIYVQPFREIFELSPFPLHFWLLLLLYPPVIFLLEEARKAVWRVRKRRNSPVGGTP